MRIVFYGIIILICVIIFGLIDQIFYRLMRLFIERHSAQVARLCFTGTLVAIIAISAIWGHYRTRFRLNVTHTDIVSERVPAAFDGYKIAQISDMHLDWFTSEEGHAFIGEMVDALIAEKPDLIVFTGDIVTIQSDEAAPFATEMTRLASAGIPVYSVLGNHDYADYSRMPHSERKSDKKRLCEMQASWGWQMLNNENAIIGAPDSSGHIALVGVENIGEPPFSTYGNLKKAMNGIEDSTFTVLLSHNPTHWRREVLPATGIDLTLSGHTHAVQVRVGNWSPSVWKYKEWAGLYSAEEGELCTDDKHQQYLYVNTGLGGVGPRVRIGVRPEISILTLRR